MHCRQPGNILEEPGAHLRGRQLAIIDVERPANTRGPEALQICMYIGGRQEFQGQVGRQVKIRHVTF